MHIFDSYEDPINFDNKIFKFKNKYFKNFNVFLFESHKQNIINHFSNIYTIALNVYLFDNKINTYIGKAGVDIKHDDNLYFLYNFNIIKKYQKKGYGSFLFFNAINLIFNELNIEKINFKKAVEAENFYTKIGIGQNYETGKILERKKEVLITKSKYLEDNTLKQNVEKFKLKDNKNIKIFQKKLMI